MSENEHKPLIQVLERTVDVLDLLAAEPEPMRAADIAEKLGISPQCVGNLLDSKRIGGCAGANPQDVDTGFQSLRHMLGCRHFCRHQHTRLVLDVLQPCQSLSADAFKSSGMCARFP